MQTTVFAAGATKAAELGFAWLRGRAQQPAIGQVYTRSATAPPGDGGPPAGLVGSTAGAAPSYKAVVAKGEYLIASDCEPLPPAVPPDTDDMTIYPWKCYGDSSRASSLQVLSVDGELRSFTLAKGEVANVLFKCDSTQNQHVSYRQDSWAKPLIGHDVKGWQCQQWG